MTKKRNKSSKSIHTYKEDKVIYESGSDSDNSSNRSKNNKNNPNTKQPIKRRPNDLLKLYEKEIINQSQYASGERLLLDYETSFRNKCSTNIIDQVKIQNSTKMNNEFHLIQNLDAWDRYNKAISSIVDLNTREVVREFIIEGKGLTEIDAKLKKRGVAEVRLHYGLKEIAKYYRHLAKLHKQAK
ncbi:MAG TPA: DUF6456 domain-containing protein [Rickettsiales bacterium]|nr:DUF6456 domain-containing protein [Rickettsiales bacterium]